MTSNPPSFEIRSAGPIRQVRQPIPFLLLLLSLLTTHASPLFGAPAPLIRAHIETPQPIYTGQHITLVVELLAPGYFDSAANFDLPDPHGLLLIPPQGSPLLHSETIDGTAYTVQRHELAVFASRAGAQTIPPISVRFAYKLAALDKTSLTAGLTTPALPLGITAPPGSEHIGLVISARNLAATEIWSPGTAAAHLKTGDALTRAITYTAPDIPGMLFPPFPHDSIDGLAIYPKTPEILDTSDRGEITGVRRDTITYVCEQPGTFTIPAAQLTWFDLDSRTLRTIDFPARTFTVAINPALPAGGVAQEASAPQAAVSHFKLRLAGTLAAACLALLLAWHFLRRPLAAIFRPAHLQPLNPEQDAPKAGSLRK